MLKTSIDFTSEADSTQNLHGNENDNFEYLTLLLSSIPGLLVFLSLLGFIIWKSVRDFQLKIQD